MVFLLFFSPSCPAPRHAAGVEAITLVSGKSRRVRQPPKPSVRPEERQFEELGDDNCGFLLSLYPLVGLVGSWRCGKCMAEGDREKALTF